MANFLSSSAKGVNAQQAKPATLSKVSKVLTSKQKLFTNACCSHLIAGMCTVVGQDGASRSRSCELRLHSMCFNCYCAMKVFKEYLYLAQEGIKSLSQQGLRSARPLSPSATALYEKGPSV